MRKASNRVRITYQLIQAATGSHLWAERFDGTLEDIFELQDQVATSVVVAISPRLEQAEIIRAKKKPTGSLDAYDCFLQGMWNFNKRSHEATSGALTFYSLGRLNLTQSLPPPTAWPLGAALSWPNAQWMDGQIASRKPPKARDWRRKAVELGKDDAVALARGGHAFGFLARDFDTGVALLDRALQLNPNLATAWVLSGLLRNYSGESGDRDRAPGAGNAGQPARSYPVPYADWGQASPGTASPGRFDDALPWAGSGISRASRTHVPALAVLAASHAQAGRLVEARKAVARLRHVAPLMRLSLFPGLFRRPEHLAQWAEGLRKAGLPDKPRRHKARLGLGANPSDNS